MIALPLAAAFVVGSSCIRVVRDDAHGSAFPAEPLPPPADFTEVEARLEHLIDTEEDAHRKDRLLAARTLARRMKVQEPGAQGVALAYLRELVALEERERPFEAPAMGPGASDAGTDAGTAGPVPVAPVVEERLEEAPRPTTAGGTPDSSAPSAGEVAARAREALNAGDAAGAVAALEACRDRPCWTEVGDLWTAARDRFVYAERERAGALFIASRDESDPAKRAAMLRDTRAILGGLIDRYPDSKHADAVRRNLELVQKEMESAGGVP